MPDSPAPRMNRPAVPKQGPYSPRKLISTKKPAYPLSDYVLEYLVRYGRLVTHGADYDSLVRYAGATTLYDEYGRDTLWNTVYYGPADQREVHDALLLSYALIKSDGDLSTVEHLRVDRVDVCLYGNTLPFRIRIVNALNDNFDYFYVKRVDANRVYGLELEHILSPNRIHYLVHPGHSGLPGDTGTLIEEHIIGMPADQFIREAMPTNHFDEVRLAKEFVKFNERCLVRLLGDMHSGNYVIDITPDFEKMQYRMRSIDFDQQSHHWRKQVYLPQFFPQNNPIVELGMARMSVHTYDQYQREERGLIAGRLRSNEGRFEALMEVMREDLIAPPSHVERLAAQLATHYNDAIFTTCLTMGELVNASLERLMQRTP